MTEEYEDDFDGIEAAGSEHSSAGAGAAASESSAAAVPAPPRTLDRRLPALLVTAICVVAFGCLWLTQHHSGWSSSAAAAPVGIQTPSVDPATFALPSGSPAPIALPSAKLASASAPHGPGAPNGAAPPPEYGAGGGAGGGGISTAPDAPATQSTVKPQTPEEVFQTEETARILAARRESAQVALQSDDQGQSPYTSAQYGSPSGPVYGGGAPPYAPMGTNGRPRAAARLYGANAPMNQYAGYSPAGGQPHQQFLAQHSSEDPGYIPNTTTYEIRRGTTIAATWITGLDSTLPGGVLKALVTENVMDSLTHSIIVIPAGSILLGGGDSQTVAGEARYLCFWDEVILPPPDNRKFFLGQNPGAGRLGENGADVSTDTHAGREFGHAILYSLIQAGLNLSTRATSTVVNLNSAGNGTLSQTQSAPPTYHRKPGESLTVTISRDLPMDAFRPIDEPGPDEQTGDDAQ